MLSGELNSADSADVVALSLRPAIAADREVLLAILRTPEVSRWWGVSEAEGDWPQSSGVAENGGTERFVIEIDATSSWIGAASKKVVGMVQYSEESDPDYRHAGIDIFLDPQVQGRGLGRSAVRTLARYLIDVRGHHRLVIDPAADNHRAISSYEAVGFRAVGVLRGYERNPDGSGWHDGLLMDLIAAELT